MPNEGWVADITYVETGKGWLYLAAIIELYSREVASWSMDKRRTRRLCCYSLRPDGQPKTPSSSTSRSFTTGNEDIRPTATSLRPTTK